MRINELLVESQQLDEGPFTQAVGKVGGKIAKGIANVGKDLKTGFKAGYSGEEPPAADPAAATTTAPAAKDAAPVKKASGGFIDQFKKGFAQGQSEPATPATGTKSAAAAAPTAGAAPAANPEADKQSKIGVGQINKIIPTLRTRDLMSLKKNLDTVIAKKSAEKPAAAPAANTATAAAPAAAASPAAPTADAPAPVGSKFTYGSVDGQPEVWTKTAKGWQSSIGGSTATGSYGKSIEKAYKQQSANNKAPQAEIDAERDRLMGVTSDSIIRKGNVMAESFSLYRKH
jgi:hypothetical protein